MCGISGLISKRGTRDNLRRKVMEMTAVMAHRGPDDEGCWEQVLQDGTFVGLGSRRLAILDVSSAGHMPMSTPDGRYTIVYNGEIYNYPELRQQLQSRGYCFRSNTDTEAILYLYQEHGGNCVEFLKGMFAIAIWDSPQQRLFLARDHFGVKPLYYTEAAGCFAFASEVKSLLTADCVRAEVDVHSLSQFLMFTWVPDPKTMFRGIYKLPAGHMAIYQNGELKISQYWDLSFPKRDFDFRTDEETLAREIRHRFSKSVKAQMLSDVPIGAFLSAGIDSTSIVSVMATESSHPVRTYTITFPRKYRVGEKTLDDPGVARRVAESMGCEHHEIVVEPDVMSLLPKLAWHLDEPIADPAVIPAYLVCSKARESVTVLLSGVGGDELFAGYRKHYAHFWSEMYRKAPSYARMAFESVVLKLPSMRGTSAKGVVRLLKKMARSGSLSPREAFLMNCTYMDESQRTGLMSSEMLAVSERQHPASRHYDYFDNVSESDFLNQLLYLDTKAFMTSLNLTYNDKMSMASSLEVRVPFLDHELAEFVAWKVPPHLKIKGLLRPKTKYIFRKAMADRLPPEVLRQPKAGFGVPIDYWLTHDLRDMVDELLSESQVRDRSFFNPAPVRRMVAEHRAGTRDWSMQIWQLLTLEIWLRTFIDRTPSAKLHDSVATKVRA